jgi:preprotein translocase subunit SecF
MPISLALFVASVVSLVPPSLYLFGGEVIKEFAFALGVGIIIGTYSSIAIASPLLVMWDDYKGKK